MADKLAKAEWAEYKLGDLFEFEAIKQAKSQRIIPTDDSEGGVPYVVQSTLNNMVSRNVSRQWLIDNNEAPVSGNRIVLGVTLPAVSYQPVEFGASQVITAKADWLNPKVGIFLAIAISKQMYRFSYNRKPGLEIYKSMSIDIPVKNGEIDFEFMEKFVAELEAHLTITGQKNYILTEEEESALRSYENIEWKKFKLGVLFEKLKTKKLTFKAGELPKQATGVFDLPSLTSSFRNQGLNYFVPRDGATILKNVISLPSNSDVYRAYYQSQEFTVLSDSYAIDWIFNSTQLSPRQYLFAVSSINKVTDLASYSYKNKLGGWNVVSKKSILLPVKNDEIDFAYMETLISALQKIVIKDVVLYADEKIAATESIINRRAD